MNKIRPILVIVMSILMGSAAVLLAANWLKQQGGTAMVPVVVAARDMPMGTRLEAHMLGLINWPASSQLKDSLASKAAAETRVLNRPVLKGEPILEGKLAADGEKGGLSAVLQEGRRAVTVKVNEIVGVAGFALPGNFVDVMVNTEEGDKGQISKILLERIQVLAVAQDFSGDESKPKVVKAVTLEVTPQQAEQIDLARSVGSLSLVLRSQLDTASVVTQGARKNDLLYLQAPSAGVAARTPATAPVTAASAKQGRSRPAKAQSSPRLEVIRGLHRTVE
jgi:pilus assembly protein CpaB